MVAQVLVDEELERLREFPEVSRDDLVRFFTLTSTDLALVDPGRGRGPGDRLGLSPALCTLSWLGFVPDDVRAAPPVAVARLAAQLQVDLSVLRSYGRREKTRQDHLRLAAQYLGWHTPAALESTELDEFLLARAMEHDSPTLAVRAGVRRGPGRPHGDPLITDTAYQCWSAHIRRKFPRCYGDPRGGRDRRWFSARRCWPPWWPAW